MTPQLAILHQLASARTGQILTAKCDLLDLQKAKLAKCKASKFVCQNIQHSSDLFFQIFRWPRHHGYWSSPKPRPGSRQLRKLRKSSPPGWAANRLIGCLWCAILTAPLYLGQMPILYFKDHSHNLTRLSGRVCSNHLHLSELKSESNTLWTSLRLCMTLRVCHCASTSRMQPKCRFVEIGCSC